MKFKNENGGAAIEFALLLPILLLTLFGIIEFGLLFYNQQVLTNASREGARAGISWADVTTIQQVAVNYSQGNMITFDTVKPLPTVNVEPTTGGTAFQDDLTVTVNYIYDFLVPAVFGLDLEKTLTGQTVMKMERQTAAP